jgi:tetratricopeptide (TPR) repeat protein
VNSQHKTTQELIDDAERLEELGASVEALGLWQTVIERERDPAFLCQFGLLAMELGMMKEARDAFLEAADLDSQLALAHDYLGMWYDTQGKLDESVRQFDLSLRIEESAATYTLRGAVQLQLGRVAEARKSLSAALNVDSHYEEAYYNLGISYSHEELSKASAFFRKAIELDPEYAKAHAELGWVLRRIREDAEAEYHLRRAIELDETDAWAHIYLGNLLWEKHDLATPEQLFKKAIDLWPNSSTPYWCLGIFYEHQDRGEEAQRLYQQALSIDPEDAQANKMFGMYLTDIGETAKARAHLERALAHNPDDETIVKVVAALE